MTKFLVLSDERTAMDTPKIVVGTYKTLLGAKRAAKKWLKDTGHNASVYHDSRDAEYGIRVA